jgi:heptosyltransferase-3
LCTWSWLQANSQKLRAKSFHSSHAAAMPQTPSNKVQIRSLLEQVPKLLLVRLRSLGDCILTLPLIEALHEWRPELHLDLMVEAPFIDVFKHHPAIHEILVLATRRFPGRAGWTKSRTLLEMRRRGYGAVLNLHGGTTSLLFTLASGARLRMGREGYRHRWGYNVHIPTSSAVWGREHVHTVEHQLTLLRWLGIPCEGLPHAYLHVDNDARARIIGRLSGSGITPGRYILVQPTATLQTKQWQEERFAELADSLAAKHQLPVVFSAGPNEEEVLATVRKRATVPHQYWPHLALGELLALLENCLLFIGCDSGPMHAAAALKKPIVVVWGSSNYRTWHPWDTDYELIRSDLPCIPCPGYSCAVFGQPKCILDIRLERVIAACDEMLRRSGFS